MLQHFGVIPFLVFDGDYLPSKAATEADRRKRREDSKKLGFELLNAGKASQAYLELQKAIDVTPEMARQLIDELKKVGVQYIVAPYEADAQMVYLERKGIIQGILSEDSDLLVFGAKCLLTKLDQYGNCIEINKDDFCACREINLTGWSDTEFRRMAILSGCDYLNSINNMGLKTAYRMVRKYKTIEKVLRMLQFDGKFHVPKGYLEAFYQAELTFLHQRVYCPVVNALVFHTEPDQPIEEEKMPFIGAHVEPAVARGVATGDLDPMTKQPIVVDSSTFATPRTPWAASRPQPRRAATTDDLKKGVSIEEFFKPRRIPLAELDPNCFTPSPTQQNVLLRNSGAWLADAIPRPYLQRAATEVEPQLPSTAPSGAMARPIAWDRPMSEARPQKRTRLCADELLLDVQDAGKGDVLGRSKFFDSPIADPSPSMTKANKAKRSKKDDITLFSDDSIEEALLNLPDFDGWHKLKPKKKSIAIFEEPDVQQESSKPVTKDSGDDADDGSQSASGTDVSQTSVPSLTQSSSSLLSSADEPSTPIDTPVPAAISLLKEKFTFTPTATPASRRPFHNYATPPSSVKQSHSRIPLAVKSAAPAVTSAVAPAKTTQPRIFTPLQSLGARAYNRNAIPPTPPYTPTSASTTRRTAPVPKPVSSFGQGRVPFPEATKPGPSGLKVALEPAEIPLPEPDKDEAVVLGVEGKGSEDLIVHDSEEEVEDGGLDVESPRRETKVRMGRFAFRA